LSGQNKVEALQEAFHSLAKTEQSSALLIYQLLSYRLAYNLTTQKSIEIPLNNKLIKYTIEKIPFFLNSPFYGLSSPDGPPILLFRGTVTKLMKSGAAEALVADFDPLGPGYSFFRWNTTILEWLKKHTTEHKAIVLGHSLGGAIAKHVTAYHWQHIKETYTFNAPGVGWLTANQYRGLENPPPLYNLNTFGDFIPSLGHERIGTDLITVPQDPEVLKNMSISDVHKDTVLELGSLIFKHPIKMKFPSIILTIALPVIFAIGCLYLAIRTFITWLLYRNSQSALPPLRAPSPTMDGERDKSVLLELALPSTP
jgi:pimeloyl-ACP methyl ester carboxylesterase